MVRPRPVTDTVTEMRQPPPNPERTVQRTPVVSYDNEDMELDLVTSHMVVLYSEGHALLHSLTSPLTFI